MPEPVTVTDYINRSLDKEYNKTAGRVLQQIDKMTSADNSALQKALDELDEEVARLDKEEQPMTEDNATLQKVLRIYTEVLVATQLLIDANDTAIQTSGQQIAIPAVTSKVFINITTDLVKQGKDPMLSMLEYETLLHSKGIPWDIPDLTFFTDQAVVSFVDSAEWIAKMEGWGVGYADLTRQTILDGILNGWNPVEIARVLRLHATNIPKSAADNLMRTLQLTSYREASLAMEKINGNFIIKKIRIATLDSRTCLSCISLHGSDLRPGQRVDDHYRGRCSEYYVVPGGAEHPEFMQVDSPKGGRILVPWQKGEDWFNSLPVVRQQQQASFLKSPGKWNAFAAGTPLSAFVTNHQDSVFGNQIMENSLKGIFGDDASQYYARNQ